MERTDNLPSCFPGTSWSFEIFFQGPGKLLKKHLFPVVVETPGFLNFFPGPWNSQKDKFPCTPGTR